MGFSLKKAIGSFAGGPIFGQLQGLGGLVGGVDVEVPAPPPLSDEEKRLIDAQTDLARQQVEIGKATFDQNKIFGEFLLAQSGYEVKDGKVVPIEGSKALEIKQLTEERYLAALKGELPVDPALERNLSESEQQLRAQLMKQIGPGYETSTPGIEALANFKKRAEEIRYSVRRGEITAGEAMTASQFGRLAGTGGQTVAGNAQAAGILGNAAQAYQGPAGVYERYRGQQFQTNLAKSQLDQENLNAIYGAVGSATGLGIGSAIALCCPEGAMIETPIGLIPIEDLRVGDSVYSLENGERVRVVIRAVGRNDAPKGHLMRGVIFEDDSALWLSFGHPLMDGRPVEALTVGSSYDGRLIAGVMDLRYQFDQTYDILPDTESGVYWIDEIPVGSTLKEVARRSQREIIPDGL